VTTPGKLPGKYAYWANYIRGKTKLLCIETFDAVSHHTEALVQARALKIKVKTMSDRTLTDEIAR